MSKLDRSKPFGEVWGDHPARFEQDGKFFNASEDEIEVEPVTVEDEAGKKTRVLRVKAVVQAEKQAEKPTKPAGKAKAKEPEQPAPAPAPAPAAADEVEDQLAAQMGETDGSFE